MKFKNSIMARFICGQTNTFVTVVMFFVHSILATHVDRDPLSGRDPQFEKPFVSTLMVVFFVSNKIQKVKTFAVIEVKNELRLKF